MGRVGGVIIINGRQLVMIFMVVMGGDNDGWLRRWDQVDSGGRGRVGR